MITREVESKIRDVFRGALQAACLALLQDYLHHVLIRKMQVCGVAPRARHASYDENLSRCSSHWRPAKKKGI